MTDLYELVQKEALARSSLYDGGRDARAALLSLMDSHGWFGQVPVFEREKVLLADPASWLLLSDEDTLTFFYSLFPVKKLRKGAA